MLSCRWLHALIVMAASAMVLGAACAHLDFSPVQDIEPKQGALQELYRALASQRDYGKQRLLIRPTLDVCFQDGGVWVRQKPTLACTLSFLFSAVPKLQ